jgi:hypothetical protein
MRKLVLEPEKCKGSSGRLSLPTVTKTDSMASHRVGWISQILETAFW